MKANVMSDPKTPNTPSENGAPMTPSNSAEKSGKFRWSRVILALSLALNLAVVGLIAGAFLGKERDAPPRGYSSRDVGYAPYISALNKDERRAVGRKLMNAAPSRDEARDARREGFEQILDALRATPYDPAALEAAISSQREDLARRQQVGQDILVERVHNMTVAERQAYAQRLDQILTRPERPDRPERSDRPEHHRDAPRKDGPRDRD